MSVIVFTYSFDDYTGNECVVNICQVGYTGATTELDSGPEPCTITMLGEGDDKFVHIKAMEAKLQLVNRTPLQFLTLFTSPVKTYYVNITRAGNFIWGGWINPEYYTEPFSNPTKIVSVSVTDGLCLLYTSDAADE